MPNRRALIAFSCMIVALAALQPRSAEAQETVRGHVVDHDGAALPQAEVQLVELNRKATTNRAGEFVLTHLPHGQQTVLVRHAGYAPIVRHIDFDAAGELNFVLDAAPFALDPLTVTATGSAIAPLTSPLPTSIVGPAAVRREHGVSLGHTLSNAPGVRVLSTGGEVGKPVVRGQFGSRVLVLERGVRLEDYSWSDEDAPSIDARLADRIEIIRGPASVLYGSDALSGVVNVIPEPLPVTGDRFRTMVEAYAASNNREVGTLLRGEGAGNGIGWRGSVIGRFAEAIHTPVGELENTGFGALTGDLAVGLNRDWGNATLRYARYGGEFKLLEKEGPPPGVEEGEEEGPERKMSDDRLQLLGQRVFRTWSLELKSQFQRHWLQEVSDELGPGGAPTGEKREVPVFDLLLNTETVELLGHHSLSQRVHGTISGSFMNQGNDSRGILPVVPDATVRDFGLAAFESFDAGALTVTAGLRGDHRTIAADPTQGLALNAPELTHDAVSADVGLALRPVEHAALTFNVGRAWRAPNLFELYANGPRIGEARFELGNPDLAAETGLSFDAGARWESPLVSAEVAAYMGNYEDYIFLSPTNQFRDGLRVHQHEQAKARVSGVEIGAHAQVLNGLRIGGVFDAVKGVKRDTDEPLPWIPAARGRVDVDFATTRIADGAQFGFNVEHVAKKGRLAPNETATDAYTLLNLESGVTTHWGGRTLDLSLRVRNLTNESYRDFLSRYKDFALNPGRDIVIRIGLGQ
jgi:iron complex outermembrane recepter protein